MGSFYKMIPGFRWRYTGSIIAFLAFALWTISLPFSMAQDIRFTSIFLFSIIGGFLIHCTLNRLDWQRVPRKTVIGILPLALLSLLPLIHCLPSGGNKRELLLGAPLLVTPWILLYLKTEWTNARFRFVFIMLLLAVISLLILLAVENPIRVWNSVRSEVEIPGLFILARPQMGLLIGTLFFLSGIYFDFRKRPLLFGICFLFTWIVLIWILSKMAILAFGLVNLLILIFRLKSKPGLFLAIWLVFIISISSLVFYLFQIGVVQEALSPEGFSFEKYPKSYVNSINSRIILWKASADVLSDGTNFLTGLPSDDLRHQLAAATGKYNGYLASQQLNPHNQFLYLLLMYGMAGLLFFGWFWFQVFKDARTSAFEKGLWLFIFLCSQTEIYFDREFGTQFIMLLIVLRYGLINSEKSAKWSPNV